MGLELSTTSAGRPEHGGPEPFYFRSGTSQLFGWLHQPTWQARSDLGLVICAPFGYEAICSHRTMRSIAEQATLLGMPAIRFDYQGTGDSQDIDAEADQLAAWIKDVESAAEQLRQRTGVKRVALVGIRLGAMLAALAAKSSAADALILIAPVVSGRRYLSEIRTTQLAAAIGRDDGEAASAGIGTRRSATGRLEVSGFSLSAATAASLAACDLATLPETLAPRLLIIDNERLPTSRSWAESLTGRGDATQYRTLPGVVEMIMTAPQFASVPAAILKNSFDWLLALPAAPGVAAAVAPAALEGSNQTLAIEIPSASTVDASTARRLTERPVIFGKDAALFGIMTEPLTPERSRRAVILVNAGADFHIGANRMYVELARDWARRGYIVLRFDLAGIGDSATRPHRPTDEVFPPAAIDDIAAAIQLIQNQYHIEDVTVGGLCSGAYHALRAGTCALPVKRLLLINPQNYFWKEGMTVQDMQLVEVVSNPGMYGNLLLSTATWKKLLTLRVNLRYVLTIIGRRLLLSVESRLRNIARRLHIPISNDLGRELEDVGARGTRVVMVFARGEAGLDLLKLQAGSSLTRLGNGFVLHVVDDADHVFSRGTSRAALNQILQNELFG
jgi:alpha-beta hydrolase superfamily lysophospholipase